MTAQKKQNFGNRSFIATECQISNKPNMEYKYYYTDNKISILLQYNVIFSQSMIVKRITYFLILINLIIADK